MSNPHVRHYRFTVDDFHRMAETGILAPDARVELIDGEIVEMTPMGPRHARRMRSIRKWLDRLLGDEAVISVQTPVNLGFAEPYPDVSVVRGPDDERYEKALPTPADVLLLVEIADSTALYDRNVKSEMYAFAGIRELWVVDLPHDSVVVFRAPRSGRYAEVNEYRRGQSWTSPALGGREVRVEDVLGPAAESR
jgi:Uma2 family endonuclease